MPTRRFAALLSIPAAALILAQCFSKEPTSPTGSGEVAATVEMTDSLRFTPASVTIHAGQAVRWRNTSQPGVFHTATADPALARRAEDVALPAGAKAFDSGALTPGGEFVHTFDVAGTYRYFCQPHETLGMVGTVTVLP